MERHVIEPLTLTRNSAGGPRRTAQWLLVAACSAALLVAAYLTALKLTGHISDLAGCSGEGGCADILGGRWANWFRIPVSLWAISVYAPLLVVGLLGLNTPVRRLLAIAGGSILIAAACWFVFVQAAIEHRFCLYCGFLHVCGLVIFTCAASQLRFADLQQRATAMIVAGMLASLTMVALVTGQLFGPQPATHMITDDESLVQTPSNVDSPAATSVSTVDAPPADTGDQTEVHDRRISYFKGAIQVAVQGVPLIGNPSARHIMLKYFDYSCATCRRMHDQLDAALAAYPDDLAVIVIPCPLNHECNPFVFERPADRPGPDPHEYACGLARVALAVWRADRTQFHAFHDRLFELQGRVTTHSATLIAESMVGQERFAKAAADPWVDSMLNDSVNKYGMLKRDSAELPKLLLEGSRLMHGAVTDTDKFIRLLQQEFHLDETAGVPSASREAVHE